MDFWEKLLIFAFSGAVMTAAGVAISVGIGMWCDRRDRESTRQAEISRASSRARYAPDRRVLHERRGDDKRWAREIAAAPPLFAGLSHFRILSDSVWLRVHGSGKCFQGDVIVRRGAAGPAEVVGCAVGANAERVRRMTCFLGHEYMELRAGRPSRWRDLPGRGQL